MTIKFDQSYFISDPMLSSRQILRLKNNEHLPVILLAVIIICMIHLCNKHDERTGNQYRLEDNGKGDSRLCPLYPSTLQGIWTRKFSIICSMCWFIWGNGVLDMWSDLEWKEIEHLVKNVQAGKSRNHTKMNLGVLRRCFLINRTSLELKHKILKKMRMSFSLY